MAKQTAVGGQARRKARQREREARWRRHVEAWRAGGGNQAEYCRQHGLTPADFSWWKHELVRRDGQQRMTRAKGASGAACPPRASAGRERAGEGTPSLFVPLQITTDVGAAACEIVLRNGQRLRLGRTADVKWIAALASALEAAPSC